MIAANTMDTLLDLAAHFNAICSDAETARTKMGDWIKSHPDWVQNHYEHVCWFAVLYALHENRHKANRLAMNRPDVTPKGKDTITKLDPHAMAICHQEKAEAFLVDAVKVYGGNTGWQVEYYPLQNWLIINVPLGTSEFEQHIQNTLTGAWWRCKDIDARCWGMFNENIYFGLGDGVVYKWDDGVTDNGSAIEADCRQARSAFDTPQLKQAVGIRPVLKGGPTINFSIVAEPEYNAVVPASKTIYDWTVAAAGDTWDEAEDTFDTSEIVFSAAEATGARWLTARGFGHVFGCRMQTSTSTKIEWLSTWFGLKTGVGI